jgi:hypothetical protein
MEQARKLRSASTGPKQLVTFSEATHNSFSSRATNSWWREVAEYLDLNLYR